MWLNSLEWSVKDADFDLDRDVPGPFVADSVMSPPNLDENFQAFATGRPPLPSSQDPSPELDSIRHRPAELYSKSQEQYTDSHSVILT